MGAVLAQKQDNGTVRPVAYVSRTLQPHERNYGVTELEALGVVWVVWHFRHYLNGHHCDVFTDHEALRSLLNTPHPSGKLTRWGLALQEVDLAIFYRPCRKNKLGGALSRSPVGQDRNNPLVPEESLVAAVVDPSVSSKSGEGSLGERQYRDPQIKLTMQYLETGELPAEYVVVFMDYLTKWLEVFATQYQSALTIAKLFVHEVVCRHGVPAQLLSDRGKAFLSQLMMEVCRVLGVKKVNTLPITPRPTVL